MRKKSYYVYIFVIISSLAGIGYSLHYWYGQMGGFDKIQVYSLNTEPRFVAGRSFVGKQTSNEIGKFFTETRDLLLDSTISGSLVVINYEDEHLESNELSQFIGIIMEGDMAEIPRGYEVREFEQGQKLAVFLPMHPLVRPGPDDIEELFRSTADSMNVTLRDYRFEIHYADNSMSVEAWIKN